MENSVTLAHFAFLTNKKNSLLIALFVAAIVHITLVIGLNFSTKQPEKINKSIDITLVNPLVSSVPEKPDFLAQENQLGAGEVAKKQEAPTQNVSSKQMIQEQPIKKIAPEKFAPEIQTLFFLTNHLSFKNLGSKKWDKVSPPQKTVLKLIRE